MKISPRELREAQIPSKAFGFNQDVVDALLERAADTIEGLIEENRQLFEALERLRNDGSTTPLSDPFSDVEPQLAPQSEPVEQPAVEAEPEVVAPAASADATGNFAEKEDLINKTLLLAQRTADETLKTAKEQAVEIVVVAQANADELVSKATLDAESVTGEAKVQADKDLADAKERAEQMVFTAQGQADALLSTAQAEADAVHKGERDEFVALVTQLTQERAQLISDIQILQTFDEEHRTKLRDVVEQDMATLVEREHIDVGSLPELPKVSDIAPAPVLTPDVESEVVAHSEMAAPASFDEMLDIPVSVDPAGDDVVEGEVVDVTDLDDVAVAETVPDDDPFASFVGGPSVVEPAGSDDDILDAQVVEPAGGQVESSGPSTTFDPGTSSKSKRHEKLDDDDFFASLREAVQDDAPLGPSSEGDEAGGKSKGLSKK